MGIVEELNGRMGFDGEAGVAEVIEGNGGLPAVTVKTKAGVEGTVYLHGGHVASWKVEGAGGGEEVLWLSGKSMWESEKPIRGGVPLCFPWFGGKKDDGSAPAHGFARLRAWELESIEQKGPAIVVTLATRSDEGTKRWWPFDFVLRHRVSFGEELGMLLELTNTGHEVLVAEEAQHTYFAVQDVRETRVTGLSGIHYVDKVDGAKEKIQQGEIVIVGETDRVYVGVCGAAVIEDRLKGRKITVMKENSKATVVWNPWVAKSKAMADFGDEEWPGMICVETCNVGVHSVSVEPGQTHVMGTVIRVDPL